MTRLTFAIRKDGVGASGRAPIYLSISHNGDTRRVKTGIILDSDKQFKNGFVCKRDDAAYLNTKLRAIITDYQAKIDDLGYTDGLTCKEVLENIRDMSSRKNKTLQAIYDEYMGTQGRLKQSSVTLYNSLFNSAVEHFGCSFAITRITRSSIMGYEKSLRMAGNSNSTIKAKISLIAKVINFAKMCGYIDDKVNPMSSYKVPAQEVREAWLTVDEIRRIRDVHTHKKNFLKLRDLFMLSYYLGGINLIDLLNIDFSHSKILLTYTRTKTEHTNKVNKIVRFYIPDEAKAIIERRIGEDGRIAVSRSERASNMHWFLRNNMANFSELVGIKRGLIFYSARKSFAQHAFNLGVSTSVIDYILGHKLNGGGTSLYSYISVTPKMATDAIRKVLDNLGK